MKIRKNENKNNKIKNKISKIKKEKVIISENRNYYKSLENWDFYINP